MKALSENRKLTIGLFLTVLLILGLAYCFSVTCYAGSVGKNHWSADGKTFYDSDKKKVKGITVIRETGAGVSKDRFYVFSKNGKLNVKQTKKIRSLAEYEGDFAPLKHLLGEEKKSFYSEGCYAGPVKNGKTPYEGGQDGILLYKDFKVNTYLAPNGKEFFLGVSGITHTTRVTKKNHSIPIRDGKKTTGAEKRVLRKVNQKIYCYDKGGKAHSGWQKIGKDYYFFRNDSMNKGYMITGKTVNRIRLKKNGQAIQTKKNRKRLKTLVMAAQIVEAATKPKMDKKEKLKAVWKYFQNSGRYRYQGSPAFHYSKQWETEYAYAMLKQKHGSCYHMGAAFAYLANACGFKNCMAVSSGGHGWCVVDGRICDPSWDRVDTGHSYYMISMSLSGKKGRPRYKQSMKYVRII